MSKDLRQYIQEILSYGGSFTNVSERHAIQHFHIIELFTYAQTRRFG